jgi:nucleoside-diphosphate kinase
VKPDAVAKQVSGKILSMIEGAGFRIVAARMTRLTRDQAEAFYSIHREKGFFARLVQFMTSGSILAAVLEGPDAIDRWRRLMGPTDSAEAPKGTVRGEFGTDIEKNAVHGSDGPDTARREVAFFFSEADLCGRN